MPDKGKRRRGDANLPPSASSPPPAVAVAVGREGEPAEPRSPSHGTERVVPTLEEVLAEVRVSPSTSHLIEHDASSSPHPPFCM